MGLPLSDLCFKSTCPLSLHNQKDEKGQLSPYANTVTPETVTLLPA